MTNDEDNDVLPVEFDLQDREVRVLGVLIEKERTTPENYPLSLNALTNGCNQKSNRLPVVSYSEHEVEEVLRSLRNKHLVWFLNSAGARVQKYEHNVATRWHFSEAQVSVLAELMLRGPQTVGELKIHAGRMTPFNLTEEVETTLRSLQEHAQGPFVVRLERLPGQKDNRYAHLFSGQPVQLTEALVAPVESVPRDIPAALSTQSQIAQLRTEVQELHVGLALLRDEFEAFKRSFE